MSRKEAIQGVRLLKAAGVNAILIYQVIEDAPFYPGMYSNNILHIWNSIEAACDYARIRVGMGVN